MYQPVALFIGLRYMRGRATDRFGRFISWLSAIGITLGVLALVTVLSVMNGFEKDLENNTLALMPQALLTTAQGKLDPQQYPVAHFALQGVNHYEALTTADVVLQSTNNVAVAVMLGTEAHSREPLFRYLVNGSSQSLVAGRYQVILGQQLAAQLNVKVGDKLRLLVPSVSEFTPMGRLPSQRLFTVSAIYAADSEVDSYQILVNQQDASRVMHYAPGQISGWRLWLEQPLNVEITSQQPLPEGLVWKDWRERKGDLFQAVKMEKNMMGLLLSLIIAVAAFNIITSLGLLIMEKQGEVAILQTQGLSRRQIMLLFMVQGAAAGVIGTIFGAIAGVLLASQLNHLLPVIGLLIDGAVLPVDIHIGQVVTIALSAMLLALLATLYPAWRAAMVQPAEALRYE